MTMVFGIGFALMLFLYVKEVRESRRQKDRYETLYASIEALTARYGFDVDAFLIRLEKNRRGEPVEAFDKEDLAEFKKRKAELHGSIFAIEYQDSEGDLSRRVLRYGRTFGLIENIRTGKKPRNKALSLDADEQEIARNSYIEAYCFLRQDDRTFRLDRINAYFDPDSGEVFGSLEEAIEKGEQISDRWA